MARGRKAIELNRDEFQNVVSTIETNNNPATRSQLWQLVSETEWAKTRQPRALTAQVAMLKAESLGLLITTAKGERGRKKGEGLPQEARDALKGPRKRRTVAPEVVAQQKKNFPVSLHTVIDKAATGNVKACIKLNCIDCSGGSKREVALCEIKTCPFWALRPYSNKKAVKAAQAAKEADDKRADELDVELQK